MVYWALGLHRPPTASPVELGTGVLWVSTGTHPCGPSPRVVKEPERQPYIHWTTCYDFEEMRVIELCSYTPSRPVRVHDLVDSGSTLTFDCCVTSSLTVLSAA